SGTGFRSPWIGIIQISPRVFGSLTQYTTNLPSGDQPIGILGRSDSSKSSSEPVPSEALTYSPHLPLRLEPNAMRFPSWDQTGIALSCAVLKVRRCILPASKNQLSPPSPSCRWTEKRFPSGATSIPAYSPGFPTLAVS